MDKNRRNFLKIMLIGGGTVVLGKVLGPVLSKLVDGASGETNFRNFKMAENRKGLTVYDKKGEEIFIMDNQKG
jgi:hypothetical protein